MIRKRIWNQLQEILDRSKYIRFSLSYGRGVDGPLWSAVIWTERGKILGRAPAHTAEMATALAILEAKKIDWSKARWK